MAAPNRGEHELPPPDRPGSLDRTSAGLSACDSPPVTFHGEAFGVGFRVVLPRRAFLSQLAAHLPHATEELPDGTADATVFTLHEADGSFHTTSANEPTGTFASLAEALEQLGRDLMIHVADRCPDRVFVHAGVVAAEGRALVLPGASFAGKSTLVAALVRAGAVYSSDEYAVLDDEGRVHPYTRALQMRAPGETRQTGVAAEALGGTSSRAPVQAALVVFARYLPGAPWQPEPVSPGLAALECMQHSIAVQRAPARVMAALSAMLAHAPAWRVERDEAGDAARRLLQALANGGPL